MSAKEEIMESDEREAPHRPRLPGKGEGEPSPGVIAVARAPDWMGTHKAGKCLTCPDLIPASRHEPMIERRLSTTMQQVHRPMPFLSEHFRVRTGYQTAEGVGVLQR
jgi:hypothetical protein